MCVALFSYTYVLDKLTETKEQEIEKISRVLVDNQNDPFDALDQIINDSNIDQNTIFLNLIKPMYSNDYEIELIELALQAFLKLNYLDICTAIRKMIDND
jgi:hypothetical protein